MQEIDFHDENSVINYSSFRSYLYWYRFKKYNFFAHKRIELITSETSNK